MNLHDMKQTPMQEKSAKPGIAKDEPYSYNHRIRLEGEHIKKLGAQDLNVGDEVSVHAHAKVTSKSSHEHEQGDEHQSIELQIIRMGQGPVEKEKEAEVKSEPGMAEYARQRKAQMREDR